MIIDPNELDFDGLREAIVHLDDAESELPEDERYAYRAAQQSVVDARRKAERHEGVIPFC